MTAMRVMSLAIGAVAFFAVGPGVDVACAQSAGDPRAAAQGDAAAFAQAQPQPKRARTRIRVYRTYPYRLQSTPYPTPYDVEYPGPGYVRQCSAKLVQEHRPNGTVIVPMTSCWWERG
jgi:hypothetical protein